MPLTAVIATASPAAVRRRWRRRRTPRGAAQRGHGRAQARDRQVLEHRQHAPVDLPVDVLAPARGEWMPGIAQHLLLELLLCLQQHLSDRRRVARNGFSPLARKTEVFSSCTQPSRIGFGSISGAPAPAGRIWKSMCGALGSLVPRAPDVAEDGPGDHLDARRSGCR